MSRQTLAMLTAGDSALNLHLGRFQRPSGPDLLGRVDRLHAWITERSRAGVWPYSRALTGRPSPETSIRDAAGMLEHGTNFASQDYLGLTGHPDVHEAVRAALDRFGPHSAGSAVLLGNTLDSLELEHELSSALAMRHVVLFPTGWAAGFGAIQGLVRDHDHVVLDERAHACLQQGARAATRNISLVPHLDLAALEARLRELRSSDARNGILVVSEGLFSMDSDCPDVAVLQAICHQYGATLLLDVAHDFGSMEADGGGAMSRAGMLGHVDLVMGSFSKTFATNGGFLASRSSAVAQAVKYFAGPHMFSNALSPLQTAAARAALRIVRSPEGRRLRDQNARASGALRAACATRGLRVLGDVSPIVPVVVGGNRLARIASALLAEAGAIANLVEYPAVPLHSTRFRFQVMASHTPEQCTAAADTLALAVAQAQHLVERLETSAVADGALLS